jgi:PIN domain nuclease of toxin-antitoxin system
VTARLLLDTHVLLRWVSESQFLSKEQLRILRHAAKHAEPLAISAITLWEVSQLAAAGNARLADGAAEILSTVEADSGMTILPLTVQIAREGTLLKRVLRDPADCIIAATARVHGLRLLTSDQRIIASNVVSTIE